MKLNALSMFAIVLFSSVIKAQLSGRVGPLTEIASKKAAKVCNILNYGGVAKKTTDNGPAIAAAWNACKMGGEVYIPAGDYGMATWVSLEGGKAVSFRLDGIIYRTGTGAGNMIFIEKTTDFEMYSSTSAGAIQGYGFQFHSAGKNGPRILRLHNVENFAVHDLALVDSPAFHFTMDTCSNGEVYNMIIRGANKGGLDGVDVWGTNMWIHDVEVTNKDECVTVKSPASYMLIQNIYCNWSGGSALGSLGMNTDIHHITYSHVYTQNSNQMMMIKSNGGNGTVRDCEFNHFIGHSNAYSLNVDSLWTKLKLQPGDGVLLHDLSFHDWRGSASDGTKRGPVRVICPDGAPCYNMSIIDFAVWTEAGSSVTYTCNSAYGSGACLNGTKARDHYAAYPTKTITMNSSASMNSTKFGPLTGSSDSTQYDTAKLSTDLKAGLGLTAPIPIPPIPTVFYPGRKAIHPKLGGM